MSAFDQVIGYENIKKEMLQVCDMIRNPQIYQKIGAVLPRGMLLYGDPGLGKTLMANAFIAESGLPAYVIRMNMEQSQLINEIRKVFSNAVENQPSIVFLDDLDKYANEDRSHRDAAPYVAVQTGIDDVRNQDVFVIATANDYNKLPMSLCRPGRFDRQIEFEVPGREDAYRIIQYYLKGKKIDETVNIDDLSRMLNYESCAALETILNEAAIYAAYERKEKIGMPELIRAVLRQEYDSEETSMKISSETMRETALHEAGHAVVSEVLIPGSVGMVSIKSTVYANAGLMHLCEGILSREETALIALAGKAAVEMYYPDNAAKGCSDDIEKASQAIRSKVTDDASYGFGFVEAQSSYPSSSMRYKKETAIQVELERCLFQSRGILVKNRLFLEKMVDELLQKGILLYSDIQRIKQDCHAGEK